MRGTALRRLVTGVCVATMLGLCGSALGRSTTDDLSVRVHLVRGSTATTTTELANDIQFDIFSDGPAQTVTMRYSLPSGLTFGGDVPDPTENCTNEATVVCTVTLDQGTSFNGGWTWPTLAAGPGTYAITATIEGTRPDPNPADNSFTFTFEVLKTGGGGGGAAIVSVTSAKAKPAKPKAGGAVTFTSIVKVDGVPAKPSKVACTATLGGKKARGAARAATGSASCRYATKKSDKGKRLSGSMRVTVSGKSFTKRFAAKLG